MRTSIWTPRSASEAAARSVIFREVGPVAVTWGPELKDNAVARRRRIQTVSRHYFKARIKAFQEREAFICRRRPSLFHEGPAPDFSDRLNHAQCIILGQNTLFNEVMNQALEQLELKRLHRRRSNCFRVAIGQAVGPVK